MSAPPDKKSEILQSMQPCICDVKAWTIANIPKPNVNRTEHMHVNSMNTMHLHSLPTSITVGIAQNPF